MRPVRAHDCEVIRADLTLAEDCHRVCEGVDLVVHAAGETGGSKRVTTSLREMFTRSLVMNSLMLEASAEAGIQDYVFLSNSSVYAPGSDSLQESDAWGDTARGMPENATGMVKRVGEVQCDLYSRIAGMRIAVIRAANAYGPNDNFDMDTSHVVPALVHKAVRKVAPFEVWGDGSTLRDFIFSDDVAAAALTLLETSRPGMCEPVNVGTGELWSILQVANLLMELTDHPGPLHLTGESPPAAFVKRLDLSRMREVGIRPAVQLPDGLRRTVEWFREHRSDY
jgi:GDP-L-fucose synthase